MPLWSLVCWCSPLQMSAFQPAELSYNIIWVLVHCVFTAFLFASSQKTCCCAVSSKLRGIHPDKQLLRQAGPRLLEQSCRCQKRQTGSQRGRWVGRQTGSEQGEARSRRVGPARSNQASRRIQAGMCPLLKPAGTRSHSCWWPQPAQADVFSYCFSASPVIIFLPGQPLGQGARLSCGKELWRHGETESQSVALEDVPHRRSIIFPRAPCGSN